jgi:hypothetical protein
MADVHLRNVSEPLPDYTATAEKILNFKQEAVLKLKGIKDS